MYGNFVNNKILKIHVYNHRYNMFKLASWGIAFLLSIDRIIFLILKIKNYCLHYVVHFSVYLPPRHFSINATLLHYFLIVKLKNAYFQ